MVCPLILLQTSCASYELTEHELPYLSDEGILLDQ